MCTVTLVFKGKDDFILTSNRDESIHRKTISPQYYDSNSTRLLYPKDSVGGGTWIGVSDRDRMVCLLNGGYNKHIRKSEYRHSRGIVVKDFLTANDLVQTMKDIDLTDIEPFTIIASDWKSDLTFYEFIWDGITKYLHELEKVTRIWSSTTLYDIIMKQKRKKWFSEYESSGELTPGSLIEFHKSAGIGDKNIDLQIDRGDLKTVSITQVIKDSNTVSMRYEDLKTSKGKDTIFSKQSLINS